jgi:hypothetical protein
MASQMQPAGGDRQVWSQTKLLAVAIDKHIGAHAQGFAHRIEERTCRLNDGGSNLLVTSSHKGAHEAIGLSGEGRLLSRSGFGHCCGSNQP